MRPYGGSLGKRKAEVVLRYKSWSLKPVSRCCQVLAGALSRAPAATRVGG